MDMTNFTDNRYADVLTINSRDDLRITSPKLLANHNDNLHYPFYQETVGSAISTSKSRNSPTIGSGLLKDVIKSTYNISIKSPQQYSITNNNNNNNNKYRKYNKNIFILSCYVIFLYLLYGYLQEYLFKKQKANFFSIYSFSQFFVSFLFSLIDILKSNHFQLKSSSVGEFTNESLSTTRNHFKKIIKLLSIKKIKLYSMLSMVLLLTKVLGNESLRFLNYKTKVLFQTSKIIPVMLIGGIIFKRSYSKTDYISVLTMILGLIFFTIGDSFDSLFSFFGLVLVLVYIIVESLKSLLYEKILRESSSELELSLFTNLFGIFMSMPLLLFSGEVHSSIGFLWENKLILFYLLCFISLGYYANIAFLNLMKITDAFFANLISAFRKFLTIVISFLIFKDTMYTYHIVGVIIFFCGLGIEISQKSATSSTTTSSKNSINIKSKI
ncbi:RhoGAP domain-containing protein [Tieghemostelium lacteum]|uniref:RhoGAP domain-containing protein n=1 Tax=Tieghemostelium lacteum TaxID=361077 RepID=A0A152A8M3_TIELA|nr:RhoGAP domain-containing protein [Tieghemostelium lacteum]|eukprot:KYR02600.1 RhoGAP domain-containing protein [Tieghemostelium lacteum]